MARIFLAIYLLIVGLSILFHLSLPIWVTGTFALIAGVLLLVDAFGVSFNRKAEPRDRDKLL